MGRGVGGEVRSVRGEAHGAQCLPSSLVPFTVMRSPVLICVVAVRVFTTTGNPYSRATTHACDSGPPRSVTTATTDKNSGVQPTSVKEPPTLPPGSSAPTWTFFERFRPARALFRFAVPGAPGKPLSVFVLVGCGCVGCGCGCGFLGRPCGIDDGIWRVWDAAERLVFASAQRHGEAHSVCLCAVEPCAHVWHGQKKDVIDLGQRPRLYKPPADLQQPAPIHVLNVATTFRQHIALPLNRAYA